uniref:AAA family ATPase n=1 Tax=Glycomyces salinus TaxID=980294 RepID=UPI0018EB84B3
MAAPSSPPSGLQRPRPVPVASAGRDDALRTAAAALASGTGMVIFTGPPGCGRTRLLERLAAAAKRPVHTGGGLAMLSSAPALALERATRARMPAEDVPLLAEAVYSRVRGGVLIIDDLQWCDAATIAVLPILAERIPIAAALRTPHRLSGAAADRLTEAATVIAVPDLTETEAADIVRRSAPALPEHRVEAVVRRGGRSPLALTALAGRAEDAEVDFEAAADPAAAAAAAIADLPRPGRTALAALGLLGRPAHPSLLGEGAALLLEAGLAVADGQHVRPASPWMAEIAAGLLDGPARVAMHTRLAEATGGIEAARHAHAAGNGPLALRRAIEAAEAAPGPSARAEALLLAAELDPDRRVEAARAALAAGRPRAAAAAAAEATGSEAALVRAWAHLATGETEAAAEALAEADPGPETDQLRLLTASNADRPALAEQIRRS